MDQQLALAGSPRSMVATRSVGLFRLPTGRTLTPRKLFAQVTAVATLAGGMAVGQLGPLAESHRVSSGTSTEMASADTGSWPSGLREAATSTIKAESYAIKASRSGEWRADNPAQGLEATFLSEGLRVVPDAGHDSGWAFGLSLLGIGRDDALSPVVPAAVVVDGGRIEYRRGDVTEWYRNDKRGIEQGFTLAAPPANVGGPLVVELDLSGDLEPRLADGGRGLVLSDTSGVDVARYDGLVAFDATGADLGAHMELADGALRLVVDDSGAAYPLTIDPVINTFEEKLTAGADANALDVFGASVAVSGGTALVGAPGNDDDGSDSGSAYVFVRDSAGNWTQQAKLTAGVDAAAGDRFGFSVAVSDDTAVVGAPFNDDPGSDSGSAYVFVRDPMGSWTQQDKLRAQDPDAGDRFGYSVAGENIVVVGAPGNDDAGSDSGSAYVFGRDVSGNWIQDAKFTAGADADAGDQFGFSVGGGPFAVVGAPFNDDPGSDSGSAYVFAQDFMGNWILNYQDKLITPDTDAGDRFGLSVAASDGDNAVVGAPFNDVGGANSGSAYVFVYRGMNSWDPQQTLVRPNADAGDQFGVSVDMTSTSAIVGAPFDDDGIPDLGSAHVFVNDGSGSWSHGAKLTAPVADQGDRFGFSVAISGDVAVVGAAGDDDAGLNSGAAYVFGPGLVPTCMGRPATIVGTPSGGPLPGTPNADVIVGLGGADIIYGYGDDDLICAGGGGDFVDAGPGDDEVYGDDGSFAIGGTNADDDLRGGQGDDELYGEGGDDELRGQFGADELYGNDGDDGLSGTPNDPFVDVLDGGAGSSDICAGFPTGGNNLDIFVVGSCP